MSLLKEKLELKIEEAEFAAQQTLSGTSPLFKWLLVFLVLGSIPLYFFAKAVSFSYWENKLKTFKVVSKPSFDSYTNLKIGQPRLVLYPDESFGAIAEINNLNLELAASEILYSWQYFTSEGQPIQPQNNDALKGNTFLLPGQKKFIVVPKIYTAEKIARAEIKIDSEIKWQKRLKLETVLLPVAPARTSNQLEPLNFTAESAVTNNSPFQIQQIRLQFLVYDFTGQLVAVSQRTENDLKPFERRAFKQLWPGLFLENSKVEIFAETNLLDPKNLILTESNSNASDLSRPESEIGW